MGYQAPLNPARYDDLINRKGVWVLWQTAQRCPCLTESGVASTLCPVCLGDGWLRDTGKRVRGLLTSHAPRRSREATGAVETGTRSFTPPRRVRLAEGDFVTALQGVMPESEVLVYGAPENGDDRLNALAPGKVLNIRAIRAGAIYTFDPAAYTDPVTGEAVLAGGVINWQDGAVDLPEPGEKFSVKFEKLECYQVVRGERPQTRFAEDKRLPDRVTLRIATRRMLRAGATAGLNTLAGFSDEDYIG